MIRHALVLASVLALGAVTAVANPTRAQLQAPGGLEYPQFGSPQGKRHRGRRGQGAHPHLCRLELWASGKPLKAYAVGLGLAPEGDKVREGDFKTPEGRLYVCTRNEVSKYHLFLGLSYPGPDDAARGLRDGLITKAQHSAILDAHRRRARPPWDTPLGGIVGIHGHGAASDWTWGCVALEDPAIEELWVACPLGTPVLIEK